MTKDSPKAIHDTTLDIVRSLLRKIERDDLKPVVNLRHLDGDRTSDRIQIRSDSGRVVPTTIEVTSTQITIGTVQVSIDPTTAQAETSEIEKITDSLLREVQPRSKTDRDGSPSEVAGQSTIQHIPGAARLFQTRAATRRLKGIPVDRRLIRGFIVNPPTMKTPAGKDVICAARSDGTLYDFHLYADLTGYVLVKDGETIREGRDPEAMAKSLVDLLTNSIRREAQKGIET